MASTWVARRGRDIDMTNGPLFSGILRFILPLMTTNLLQQFYSAADIMIVGLSSEANAVGALGATSAFLSLILNLFIGFSIGANVIVARHIGASDQVKVERSVHTAVAMGLLFGLAGGIVGSLLVRPVLLWMGYTGTLLSLALRYSYIYLACLPFLSLTNFLSCILQAQGNTRITLWVLSGTGILNVGLNFLFVTATPLSVEGVAIATAIANLASATILLFYLYKRGGVCRFSPKKLCLDRAEFMEIVRVGLPSGLQNAMFSISNILISSAVLQINNAVTPPGSAYDPVIKSSASMASIESFIFGVLNATTATASAFTAQNVGAKQPRRITAAFLRIMLLSFVNATVFTAIFVLLRNPLLALYGVSDSPDLLGSIAYDASLVRIWWKWPGYFIFALMNACAGTLRGLGKSAIAALISFFGTCVFRVLWIGTVFVWFPSLESIYLSYPVSYFITAAVYFMTLLPLLRRAKREPAA